MTEIVDQQILQETQDRLSCALGRSLSMQETQLLLLHLRYVLEANETVNLTSIIDEEEGLLLHVEDSLTALQEIENVSGGKLVDLGSGGGFPGIPLAITTGRHTTLIEATRKKASVVEGFIRDNGMSDKIVVVAKRIEEYSSITRECFTVAVARALAPLSSLMELAAPLLVHNGTLIAYKGNLSDDEIRKAREAEDILGMKMSGSRKFLLSDGKTQRELVLFKKTKEPGVELPRRNGKAQQRPY